MKRADRHDDSYDNSMANPRSQQSAPSSYHELKASLATVRSQKAELQQRVQETETQAESYLILYNEEKSRSSELLLKYEQAQVETQHYLTLYTETQAQLKLERRSKAGIKGWETRRKRENQRLKQEIGEMTLLLHDSLARKDQAIAHLDDLAERMDRIQRLVDSVEGDPTNNPANLLQKVARIWQAIKDILAE